MADFDFEGNTLSSFEVENEHTEIPVYPETLQSMATFIRNKGGKVRFDEYMQESLFGQGGFYAERVKFGTKGHFKTEALKPEFAGLLADYLESKGLISRDFVEIGGGDGTFKRNFLQCANGINYISVDASPKLAELQKEIDGKETVRASATELPFAPNSLEGTVFANELLDALPCRVFEIAVRDNGKIELAREANVSVNSDNNSLKFELGIVERDMFVDEYEEFLNEHGRRVNSGEIVSVSPHFRSVLAELNKVLREGSIMLIDYGFSEDYVTMKKDKEEQPYFWGPLEVEGVEKILERPYETDITYSIDFKFLVWLAKKINPGLKVSYSPQHHFFMDVMKNSKKTYDARWTNARRSEKFAVLELEK